MTELTSYSLISYDRVNAVYTLHVLVHDRARTVLAHPLAVAVEHTTFFLAVSVDFGSTAEEYRSKRSLEMHVSRLLEQQLQPSANNAERFAEVYRCTGQWDRREALLVQVVDTHKQVLGEEHLDTLKSMNNLALTYISQGRFDKAEVLLVQVLDGWKRVLGEQHPDTLTSMNNLASTYWSQGRFEQAEVLQLQVLDTRKQVPGEQHPDTLSSMSSLASIYKVQERFEQAEVLQVQAPDG
jgi:tetratricopeptide (TPR) repeat protein